MNQVLKEKLKKLPYDPGVYLMKNARGEIIYVGKARHLRNRVSSYFYRPDPSTKTAALVSEIEDLDLILTKTELEALLLERTLIRDHMPKFNVLLRDDKEYPYVRVNFNEPWPRVEKVRRRRDDGATYLGPFGSAGALKVLLDASFRIFPVIRCARPEMEGRKRPCNYYQMKMCLGQCVHPVDREHYLAILRDVMLFLAGKNKELEKAIRGKMDEASQNERYEAAAAFRDQLFAMKAVQERQSSMVHDVPDADVFGIHEEQGLVAVAVVEVRDGRMVAAESYLVNAPVQEEREILEEFLIQYYDSRLSPAEVILPLGDSDLAELEGLAEAISHLGRTRTTVRAAKQGSRKDLLDIARKNARYRIGEAVRTRAGHQAELEMLRKFLGMKVLPRRMECVDVANWQGKATVASCVCFVDGKAAKHLYRQYNPETVEGQDDFAVVREVVRRRLARGLEEGTLPDLLVIDGGKAQLDAAMGGAAEAGVTDGVVIVGLAKSRVEDGGQLTSEGPRRSDERVFLVGQDVSKPMVIGSAEYRLLTRVRDEAHRFANLRHRRARGKEFFDSELTNVSGIGEAMRRRLLESFGGMEGIRRATLEQLCAVKGLRDDAATALHARLRQEEEDSETS